MSDPSSPESMPASRYQVKTCPMCEGSSWSRSASGRCTFCNGTGVVHRVAGGPRGPICHAGKPTECVAYPRRYAGQCLAEPVAPEGEPQGEESGT